MILSDKPIITALETANGATVLRAMRETSIKGVSEVWPQVAAVNAKIPVGNSVSAISSDLIDSIKQN